MRDRNPLKLPTAVLAVFALLSAAGLEAGLPQAKFAAKPSHVVLVVIDGLSYKTWDKMDLPVLDGMISSGALVKQVFLPPAAHPHEGPYAKIHTCSIPNPILMSGTIFIDEGTVYFNEQFFPNQTAAFAVNAIDYRTLTKNYHYVYQKAGSDAEAMAAAAKFMEMGQPAFLSIHLQDTGEGGVASMRGAADAPWKNDIWQPESPYRRNLTTADRLLGEFLQGLANLGLLETTAFVVVGDHGQADTGWHPLEFWDPAVTTAVMWGAGIKAGAVIDYAELIDIGPTICALMGLSAPPHRRRGGHYRSLRRRRGRFEPPAPAPGNDERPVHGLPGRQGRAGREPRPFRFARQGLELRPVQQYHPEFLRHRAVHRVAALQVRIRACRAERQSPEITAGVQGGDRPGEAQISRRRVDTADALDILPLDVIRFADNDPDYPAGRPRVPRSRRIDMKNMRPAFPVAVAIALAAGMIVFLAGCGPSPSGREGAAADGAAVQHSFVIQNTDQELRLDGRLAEAFWKNADRLGGFRVDSDPGRVPPVNTEVLLAFGGEALYAAFVLEVPRETNASAAGDICEISIFSRPETPFYSPYLQRLDYMNANEAVRTMRRFEVTAANERRQANVYKVGPHTSYIIDYEWKSGWQTAASAKKGSVVIEASIPWADIGGLPRPGHTFRVNLVRTRQTPEGAKEGDWFNWCSGPSIPVKPWASENFIQEYPTIFATARIEDSRAVLSRFVETEDPWRVPRPETEYEKVLTGRPDPARMTHFYLGLAGFLLPESIKKLYDQKTWEAEEANMLAEFGEAGVNGPFLPGFLEKGGLERVEELHKKYGMTFSFHGYANGKQAAKDGATILTPGGAAAFFDPAYIRLKNKMLEDFLGKHGKAPWLADVWGQDEPFNQISTILQPGTHARVDAELKKAYGVGLGVPEGIAGAAYQDQPVHADSRVLPDRPTALSRIAMFRWMNKTYSEVARGEYAIVRRLAPGKPYQAFNRNAVADMDFLDQAYALGLSRIISPPTRIPRSASMSMGPPAPDIMSGSPPSSSPTSPPANPPR